MCYLAMTMYSYGLNMVSFILVNLDRCSVIKGVNIWWKGDKVCLTKEKGGIWFVYLSVLMHNKFVKMI